jgi:hypothetical protein
MPDYLSLQATASRLISESGKAGVIRRATAAENQDPMSSDEGTTDIPCRFVELDFTFRERQNTAIQTKDFKALVSVEGLSGDIDESDMFGIGEDPDVFYEIVTAIPLRPGETTLMWTLQVRR